MFLLAAALVASSGAPELVETDIAEFVPCEGQTIGFYTGECAADFNLTV